MPANDMTRLLQDVRNYLDITWDDPDGDKKLSGIISRGIVYLDRIAGTPQDYMAEGDARGLLFDFVRYVRAGALNEFLDNYLPELQALQITAAGEGSDETADV